MVQLEYKYSKGAGMKLNSEITRFINSPVKLRLLKYVLAPGFNMTGRELSRISKISHTSANRVLKDFESANLVYSRKAGTALMWNVNTESFIYEKLSAFLAESGTKPVNRLIEIIHRALSGAPVKRAVLFGSTSRGDEKEGSDIDLFILVAGEKDKQSIEPVLKKLGAVCIKMFGNPLMPYILSEKEYEAKKNLALIGEVEKGKKII
jgi:predicted nucleotidyltransferase